MPGFNLSAIFEIGDAAREPQYALVASGRKIEARDRELKQRLPFRIRRAKFFRLISGELRIALVLADHLPPARGFDARSYRSACLPLRLGEQVILTHLGHLDLHVDAVQQGSRNPVAVACDLVGRAMALAAIVAEISAWTGVHRRDQLEFRREIRPVRRARDGDVPGLQGFPKRLQNTALELILGISNNPRIFQYSTAPIFCFPL